MDPDDPNQDTVHVVANAIYFKGEWRFPFKKENTFDREFHRLDGSSIEVPFLQSWCSKCIACHKGFKVLKLPYEEMDDREYNWEVYRSLPKFSMCVFLPNDRKGLRSVVEKIASSPKFLHNHLPTEYVPVGEFRLPKFKLTFESNIVDDLNDLGLHLPFDDEKANMTDMLLEEDKRGLSVNGVLHKAVIEMNEEGSEAAAVTVESDDDMGYSLYDDYVTSPEPVNFVADHPFAFFIVEETSGATVFAGHVLDPSKEQ
ncbi:putative serpin-Z5 [Phragmites australis]|uniref:putative serpin-Z5 n=1 Tax=Phragmites australis TaxID=29695 RepID=UPI002D76C07B|nr:putative serpin-Z5 [Phragmites australis]